MDNPSENQRTILIVDDDDTVRNFVSRTLGVEGGYNLLVASSGEEALEKAGNFDGTIHLLLSNVQMPGMTGLDLSAKLSLARPDLKVILMSGFEQGLLVLNEGWHFIHKPFVPSSLRSIVATVFSQPDVPNLDERRPKSK